MREVDRAAGVELRNRERGVAVDPVRRRPRAAHVYRRVDAAVVAGVETRCGTERHGVEVRMERTAVIGTRDIPERGPTVGRGQHGDAAEDRAAGGGIVRIDGDDVVVPTLVSEARAEREVVGRRECRPAGAACCCLQNLFELAQLIAAGVTGRERGIDGVVLADAQADANHVRRWSGTGPFRRPRIGTRVPDPNLAKTRGGDAGGGHRAPEQVGTCRILGNGVPVRGSGAGHLRPGRPPVRRLVEAPRGRREDSLRVG